MLVFPHIVKTEPIGKLHLLQRLFQQPVLGVLTPGPGQLVFVQQTKFHRLVYLEATLLVGTGTGLAASLVMAYLYSFSFLQALMSQV